MDLVNLVRQSSQDVSAACSLWTTKVIDTINQCIPKVKVKTKLRVSLTPCPSGKGAVGLSATNYDIPVITWSAVYFLLIKGPSHQLPHQVIPTTLYRHTCLLFDDFPTVKTYKAHLSHSFYLRSHDYTDTGSRPAGLHSAHADHMGYCCKRPGLQIQNIMNVYNYT